MDGQCFGDAERLATDRELTIVAQVQTLHDGLV